MVSSNHDVKLVYAWIPGVCLRLHNHLKICLTHGLACDMFACISTVKKECLMNNMTVINIFLYSLAYVF